MTTALASRSSSGIPASSGNPALSERVVEHELVGAAGDVRTMSTAGTALKTFVLLAFLIAGGAWGWASATTPVGVDLGQGTGNTTVTIPGGFWLASFAALFVGIAVAMAPRRAALLGIVYALLQGYCLGAISAAFNAQTDGIVAAAVLCTACVFGVSLFLYATRIVRPTQRMAFGVIVAIGGLSLFYMMVWMFSIFDASFLYSEEFRSIGILVSILSVILAALTLTLDFAVVEAGVDAGAPKYMEWYCGYGLMVSLIWLYISLLRLLAFLSRR